MKQKNLILMVVAVGCGLVAALLTSQMSARQTKVEMVDVIVAAKDLPVGTMITREDIPKMTKIKKMPKDAVPPLFVQSEDDLVDKRLSRGIRLEESFNPQDLNKGGTVTLPKGMDMISMQVGLSEAVAGFVTPGSRVDILATAKTGNRQIAFPLLVDMLVLAVDQATTLPKESGTFAALNTVSFAVDRKQALLLQLARTRGCSMSLVLRHPDKDKSEEAWKPEDVIRILSNPDYTGGGDGYVAGNPVTGEDGAKTEAPKPKLVSKSDTVQLPIATVDLPAGTELTVDVLKKFELKDVAGPAPENAVLDIQSIQGKVLQNGIVANQWLPKAFVGSMPTKPTPRDEFHPNVKDGPTVEAPKVTGPARKSHNVVVVTGSGHRTFRYEEKQPGEWVLVGEVNKSGDAQSTAPPVVPAPSPEPAPSAKMD